MPKHLIGSYFNEKETFSYVVPPELKTEVLLEFDDFRRPLQVDNLKAVATLIHSLLFLEPGTYPDCPSLGIGIQNYQFELMNEETIDKIKDAINFQVGKYLPTIYIRNLIVKKINNQSISNTLGIGFEISFTQPTDIDDKPKQFFLLLQEVAETREILSQIIY